VLNDLEPKIFLKVFTLMKKEEDAIAIFML
jgi:hypothetical protein